MLPDWQKDLTRDGHRVTLSGLPIAMHCHHYNINLQKMLEDTLGEAGVDLLVRAAEEASFVGFRAILSQYSRIRTLKSKLELASTLYQNCGLGVIRFERIGRNGGGVVSPSSHHVTGWLAKHGARSSAGCHFARGWIAGVLSVIFSRTVGAYAVKELSCKMARSSQCTFQVKER
jgi:hypothetical protein